jgi:hypothetical protein
MVNNLIYLFTEKNISKLVNYLCFTNDKERKKQVQATCGNMCTYLLLPCSKQVQRQLRLDERILFIFLSDHDTRRLTHFFSQARYWVATVWTKA